MNRSWKNCYRIITKNLGNDSRDFLYTGKTAEFGCLRIYANLNMCNEALTAHKAHYNRVSFMIRSKAFKSYKEGSWKIHSLYEDNNWKVDWGKDHCWYCGKPVEECGKLTAEHIFPRAKGGDDSFDNIAYACKSCNSSKSKKDLIIWMSNVLQVVPSFAMVCIYMKLVYKYSLEHNLMEMNIEDINNVQFPFDYHSLALIEQFVKEDYLKM